MAATGFAQERQGFTVVVHPRNNLNEIDGSLLSDIFLKKISTWSDGSQMQPIDLNVESATRRRFSELVHGRDVAAIRSYWQRQIFTGLGVPPQEVSSDAEVIDLVRSRPGAIGYIASDNVPEGVKRLRLVR